MSKEKKKQKKKKQHLPPRWHPYLPENLSCTAAGI